MPQISKAPKKPIKVGLVFAAFPTKHLTPYKYFLLLLNALQRSCQFELFDISEDDPFITNLNSEIVDADAARKGLEKFGTRIRKQIAKSIKDHDLAREKPDQLIIITGATLSDHHYLIRRKLTTMLALGDWEKGMAPPSLAEFLQLLVLRAPYSALEGDLWNTIHLGNRACIFDFTENLDNTRLMALTGVGVCSDCAESLDSDGFPDAAIEIKRIASRDWRGKRTLPGTPANIMARLGYDLYLTKGFEPSFGQRLRGVLRDEITKELIRLFFAVLVGILVAFLLYKIGLKG